ncbi:MAG: hypothetical protein ABI186_02070 [Candidatus Elarobacter sp.]
MRARVVVSGAFFILAGALHFLRPEMYEKIVPPALGHARELVALSGIAEIAGGVGLLIPATRRAAGFGLIALLLAVWPANIFMALDARRFAEMAPAWVLWGRVPLQLVLIWWVERISRKE